MLVNDVDFDTLCDPRTLVLETGEVLHPDLRTKKEASEKDALVKALDAIKKLTDALVIIQEENKLLKKGVLGNVDGTGKIVVNGTDYDVYLTDIDACPIMSCETRRDKNGRLLGGPIATKHKFTFMEL